MTDFDIPQDFLDIDPDPAHWCLADYGGTPDHPALWTVPSTDPPTDMTDAMMSEIPGQDDTVTPLKLEEQRFYKFCMAFLLQDGNLAVPGGRYGSDTRLCAPVAIAMALAMRYHNGEPITYYSLNSDMGQVVNGSDGVTELLSESGYIFDDNDMGIDVHELLGDEYVPQSAREALSQHFINASEQVGHTSMDMTTGDLVVSFNETDAAELCDALNINYKHED